MFELNDQELEQVAGGLHIGTGSGSSGGASVASGTASSYSYANSVAGPREVSSYAGNTSSAEGKTAVAISSSGSGASADNK